MSKLKKIILAVMSLVVVLGIVVLGGMQFFIYNVGKECTEGLLFANEGIDTIAETQKVMLSRGIDVDVFENLHKGERLYIPAKEDYQIPATLFAIDGNKDNDTIILLHGQTGDRTSTYDVAEIFLDLGINILAIDQRDSGLSEFPYITFGHLEKKDLGYCIDYIKGMAVDKKIGVYGQSMGAATIGLYLGEEEAAEKVDFAIMDSSYDNMTSMLKWGMEEQGTEAPIEEVAEWCSDYMNKYYGFGLEDVDVVKAMMNNQVPTLVIQGLQDELCLPYMGEALYQAIPKTNNKSELWKIDVPHVLGIELVHDEYVEKISKFIKLQ